MTTPARPRGLCQRRRPGPRLPAGGAEPAAGGGRRCRSLSPAAAGAGRRQRARGAGGGEPAGGLGGAGPRKSVVGCGGDPGTGRRGCLVPGGGRELQAGPDGALSHPASRETPPAAAGRRPGWSAKVSSDLDLAEVRRRPASAEPGGSRRAGPSRGLLASPCPGCHPSSRRC